MKKSVITLVFFFAFINLCSAQNVLDKEQVLNLFVDLEDRLIKVNEKIEFMTANEIYDLKQLDKMSIELDVYKEQYLNWIEFINRNEIEDLEILNYIEVIRLDINVIVDNYNIYQLALMENDKSERTKLLAKSIEDIFKGFK